MLDKSIEKMERLDSKNMLATTLDWNPSPPGGPWIDFDAADANWMDAETGRLKWAEGDIAIFDSTATAPVDAAASGMVLRDESHH